MTWPDEVTAIRIESRGDLALFAALLALRKTENGGPGKEFGVLTERAPAYVQQLHVAAVSLRNTVARVMNLGLTVRTPDGFFTDAFLETFSSRWAPLGAANDPENLNANHLPNLKMFHARAVAYLIDHLDALTL